jgi:hypothetical protein
MASSSFGGSSSLSGYTDNFVTSTSVSIPDGRATANGQHPVRVTALAGYAAGRGAARSATMSLGSASTSAFTLGSGSSASSTGGKSISLYVADGASVTFKIDANGSFYFGRGGSGTTVDSYGTSFAGRLGGSFTYVQAPTAPRTPAFTRDATSATVTWTAPSDNGGSAVTGYTIQWSTSSSFTSPTTVTPSGTGLSATVTGLPSGTAVYFRVAARNAVTANFNTTSVWANATGAAGSGIGEVWNGSAWVTATTVEVWNGTAWVAATSVETWNGSAWVSAV